MRVLALVLVFAVVVHAYVDSEWRPRRQKGKQHSGGGERRGRGPGKHHAARYRDERTREGHTRHGDKRRLFPDILAPWMKGHFSLGSHLDLDWDLGDLMGQVEHEWWKGPNVCVRREEKEEEEKEEDGRSILTHHVFTQTDCDETDTAYKCVTRVGFNGKMKTYTTVYECCYGYSRVNGKSGCPIESELEDLLSTIRQAGSAELARGFDNLGLTGMLRAGNFTVFAPTDQAFKRFKPNLDDEPNVVMISPETRIIPEQTREMLVSHVIRGFHRISQLNDEQLIQTLNPGGAIRINFYGRPRKMVTVNCAPVVSSDNLAENGIVHSVDGVLTPVYNTLIDLISSDPQLTTFKTLLSQTGLVSQLKQPGQFTLLAPTDAAFDKLDPTVRKKLVAGHACTGNLVRYHLLPNVICSSVIEGRARSRNVLGSYVSLSRSEDGKLFSGDAQMVNRDIMATNGVLHILDDVLIPDEAMDITDVAKRENASEFMRLARSIGFEKVLYNMDNFTVFLPTDEAFEDLSSEQRRILTSEPETLRRILQYHVATQPETCPTMYSGQMLETLNDDHKITIKTYHSAPFGLHQIVTAQCAPMIKKDLDTCNGVIHMVDKVLIPPKGDLLDTLALDSKFSTLVSLLKKAGMAEGLQLNGPMTIFAPTNQAFEELGQEAIAELAEAADKLRTLLQHHIIKGYMCCAAVFPDRQWPWNKQRERALDGHPVSLTHKEDHILLDNHAQIDTCDITASNGVVHAINKVLPGAFHRHGGRHQGYQGRVENPWSIQGHIERVRKRIMDDFDWP